jgi:hypothetical protein
VTPWEPRCNATSRTDTITNDTITSDNIASIARRRHRAPTASRADGIARREGREPSFA